jgi:hypothetical protein
MINAKEIAKWIIAAILVGLMIAFVAYVKRDVEQRRDADDRLELKKRIEQAQQSKTARILLLPIRPGRQES